MSHRLGIDLGGTKIEAAIIDDELQAVKRRRVPTDRDSGYESIIKKIVSLPSINPPR